MNNFYDCNRLVQVKDLDGLEPEIFMCVGNRTAGKTFSFKRKMIRDFKTKKMKFAVLKRLQDDLKGVAEEYFKDLEQTIYPGESMTEVAVSTCFYKLFLNGEHCGYTIALNGAERIRNRSAIFSDVDQIHFDEFQSENNAYVPNELQKFQSIHTSIARGKGKQARYVPVYMTSNTVTLLNPYYEEFGIATRLKSDTKILRGHGWVLEQTYNENAAAAIATSGFGRAFASSEYMNYARENKYLNDNMSMIEQPSGDSSYVCSIILDGKYYGLRYYPVLGVYYVTSHADKSHPVRVALVSDDHSPRTILTQGTPFLIRELRDAFSLGFFRFENLKCKEVILHMLAIR